MKRISLVLFLAFVAVSPDPILSPGPLGAQAGNPRAVQEGGEVRGRVLGKRMAALVPLSGVTLDFSRGARHRTAVTDSLGRYSVPGLLPGTWQVRTFRIGYEGTSLQVLVPRTGHVQLDLELPSRPISLPPVTIRARPLEALLPEGPPPTAEVGELNLRALEGSPGMVEGGLTQVVRSLPGNSDPADPTDVLLMRGSAADLKLVLLDGAPVYTPFHLGGLVESFDPGTLGGASLFLGGAPARFDGGLSYILDLKTRSPSREAFHGAAAADLLTSRLRLEGPLLGGGVLLGSRTVHGLGASALNREESPYGYTDLLVRGDWGSREGPRAFVTGFWNREEVELDLGELAYSQGAIWGNQALSAGMAGSLGGVGGQLRVALTRYDARLPVADSLPFFARSISDRLRITGDLSIPWGDGLIRAGASVDGLAADYRARGLDTLGTVVVSSLNLHGIASGVYLEGDRPLTHGLRFRGGLRLDHFSSDGAVRLAPRGALTWFLTDEAALTVAAGQYHQFSALSSSQVERSLAEANRGFQTSESEKAYSVGAANHLAISLDQVLAPGLRLGLEGYVKSFSGMTGVEDGQLNASGFDLRVAREGDGASGWLGYTLTWFWASDGLHTEGDSRFSGRHLLSAGLSTKLTENTGFRLRVGYGDGLPYTSIPLALDGAGGPPTTTAGNRDETLALDGDNVLNQAPGLAIGPDDGFLRVEGEIYGSWSANLAGRATRIRPFLRVLNALNRRDALFYHFDPWRNETPRPLAELPVLPLVGLEWVF